MKRNKFLVSLLSCFLACIMLFTGCNSINSNKSNEANSSKTKIYDVIEEENSVDYCFIDEFHEGLAVVHKEPGGPEGYIDKDGNVVIELQFLEATPFSEGLAAVRTQEGWYGYIDKKGNMVIEPVLKYADPFCNGKARVQTRYHWYYIDKEGNILKEIDDD